MKSKKNLKKIKFKPIRHSRTFLYPISIDLTCTSNTKVYATSNDKNMTL